jgi:hypothetical protein
MGLQDLLIDKIAEDLVIATLKKIASWRSPRRGLCRNHDTSKSRHARTLALRGE